MTISDRTSTPERGVDGRRRHTIVLALLLALALGLPVAYLTGRHAGADSRGATLTGRAYVGVDQAAVQVDGWAYGFVPSSTTWYDAAGEHEGSTAPCLRTVGSYARIRFGEVSAPSPDGGSARVVTWVRCLP